MAHELLPQSRKLNKWRGGAEGGEGVLIRVGGLENFLKKISGVPLVRDSRGREDSQAF